MLQFSKYSLSRESLEPKIPLLYSIFFELCQRQLDYGGSEKATVGSLLKFLEVLGQYNANYGGQQWGDILGAIGLSSSYKMSPRAKFLTQALILFLRSQLLEGDRLHLRSKSSQSAPETRSLRRK